MSLAERLASSLLEREGVEERRSRFGHETAFYRGGREFLHFHGDHAVDVRLGLARIRERPELETRPGVRVRVSGSSDWVVVALERQEDAEFVLELVDELLTDYGRRNRPRAEAPSEPTARAARRSARSPPG
jgi:hypothetical protein